MSSSVCGPLRKIQSGIYPKQTSISPGSFVRENERYSTAFPVCLFVARKREREWVVPARSTEKIPLVARYRPTTKRERNTRVSVGASCVVTVLLLSSAFVPRYSVELLDIPSRSEFSTDVLTTLPSKLTHRHTEIHTHGYAHIGTWTHVSEYLSLSTNNKHLLLISW